MDEEGMLNVERCQAGVDTLGIHEMNLSMWMRK